ncbi:MAG: GNAT family N-acetyltransferase [Candidatus Riflebacteria bacterium]|nr:GNAT family N-acetyltransferase [Candidatus Riflebacteria bacterium]
MAECARMATPSLDDGPRRAQKEIHEMISPVDLPSAWGKGFVTEAVQAVLQIGFTKYSLSEVLKKSCKESALQRNIPPDHRLCLHVLYKTSSIINISVLSDQI